MPSLTRLAPLDIPLALRLTSPASTIATLAQELAVAPSQIHASLRRLEACSLLRPGQRATNPRALHELLVHGIRYVFPAERGNLVMGVPTAYSAPPLNAQVDPLDVLVWPAAKAPAPVQGFRIPPLYPAVWKLAERSPATYHLVAITDALRLGDPRIRLVAREQLESALGLRA